MGEESSDESSGTAESEPAQPGEKTDYPSDAGEDGQPGRFGRTVEEFRRLSRRQQLLGGGTMTLVFCIVVLVALVPSGVLGLAVSDSATFEATPATPGETVLAETGYVQTGGDTVTVRRTISPAGQDRTIIVNNERRTYEKTVDVQDDSFTNGVFVVLSTPAISVAGSSQNPFASLSHEEILQRFESDLDPGSGELTFERVDQRDAAMLGQSTTVSEFRTQMAVENETREFAVYVTKVRSDGDIVVAVGLHPTAFADERVSVMRLFHAVDHPSS